MKLIGEKVILRPIVRADASRFVKWMNDREVTRLSRGPSKKLTLEEERKWIKSIPKLKDQKHFSICTFGGTHIGGIGFKTIDTLNRYAEIAITIGDKRYWNKKLGTDAMRTLINWGFKEFKLHRIELEVYEYNARGIKLYRRLGFKLEGKMRERVRWGGRYHDVFQMGILRSEWTKKKNS
ncbi:MAG: GNAT family protein [Candidatus Jorgensenbacteria bacterium]